MALTTQGGLIELAAGSGAAGQQARSAYADGLSLEQELRLQEEFADDVSAFVSDHLSFLTRDDLVTSSSSWIRCDECHVAWQALINTVPPTPSPRLDFQTDLGGDGARVWKPRTAEERKAAGEEDEMRVLPVYLFSLLGLEAVTLLDHRDEGSARCGGCLAVAGP